MPLTWRDVAAPDFSPALRAQLAAAELIKGALGTAGAGINAFDAAETARVNQVAQANLLKYQDPAQLQAALQSGALFTGLDPARIRPETMTTANSRVGDLLSTAVTSENLTQGKYNNQYLNGDRLREMDARLPYAASIAGSGGNPALAQLPVDVQARARGDNLSVTGTINGLNEAERTRQIRDFSIAVGPQIAQMTPNQLRELLNSDKYTPEQKAVISELGAKVHGGALLGPNAVVDQYDAYRPTSIQPAAAKAAPEPTTGDATYNIYFKTGVKGTPRVNLAEGTLADKIAFGETQIQDTKDTVPGGGTSAAGRYQIVNKTAKNIAPILFGENWQSVPFNADTQEKMGSYLYGQRVQSKGNMVQEWQGLRNIAGADAEGAWKGIPWSAARDVIAQFESGGAKVLGDKPTMADVRAYAQKVQSTPAPVAPVTVANFRPQPVAPVATPAVAPEIASLGNTTIGRGISAGLSALGVNTGATPAAVTPVAAAIAQAAEPIRAAEVPPLTSAIGAKMLLESVNKETNFNASLLPIANDAAAFTPNAQGVPELTQELLAMPMFKGGDRGQIINQMNSLVQKGVTPRVAAAILKNSVTEDTNWPGFNLFTSTDNISGARGAVVIDEKVRDNLTELAKGNKEISKVQQNNEVQKEFTTAQTAKLAELTKLEADRMTQKIRADQGLPGAAERYAAMNSVYQQKLKDFQDSIINFQAAKRK